MKIEPILQYNYMPSRAKNLHFASKNGHYTNVERGAALLSAALMTLSAISAPMVRKPIETQSIVEAQEQNFSQTEQIQKITQRIFELEAEYEDAYKRLLQNEKRQSEIIHAKTEIYDKCDEMGTHPFELDEDDALAKEFWSLQDEWWKTMVEYGAIDVELMYAASDKVSMKESLYRLDGDNRGVINVKMPITLSKYTNTKPEVQEGILNSSKNFKYQQFLDELLAQLPDTTPKSVFAKIKELDDEIFLTRNIADNYLSAIEGFRKNAIEIMSAIDDLRDKKQEFEENKDTESESYIEIKEQYSQLQNKRDENYENWREFNEQNEASYEHYINLIMAKSVLIDYLKN